MPHLELVFFLEGMPVIKIEIKKRYGTENRGWWDITFQVISFVLACVFSSPGPSSIFHKAIAIQLQSLSLEPRDYTGSETKSLF